MQNTPRPSGLANNTQTPSRLRWRSWRSLGSLFVLCGVLSGWLIGWSAMQQREEHTGVHWLYALRGARPAPPEVVIINLDSRSANNLGLPNRPDRWPRRLHARLLDGLHAQGARVVGFDLLFERAREAEDDQLLAQAIARAGNVVLVEYVRREQMATAPGVAAVIDQHILPLPLFVDAAWATGPFMLPKTLYGISSFWSFTPNGGDQPTMPMLMSWRMLPEQYQQAASLLQPQVSNPPLSLQQPAQQLQTLQQTAQQLPHHTLRSFGDAVEPNSRQLTEQLLRLLHDNGPHALNFYGPAGRITTIPYDRALSLLSSSDTSATQRHLFAGKAVFIGFSEFNQPEQRDAYNSPFSQENGIDISGVEFAATALANLLDGSLLTTPGTMQRILLLSLFGGLLSCIWLFARVRHAWWLTLLLIIGYIAFTHQAFTKWYVTLPLFIPLLVQTPLLVGLGLGLKYQRAERQRQRLHGALEHYLPSSAINQIARELHQSDDGLVYAACLCSDIEGYTTLAEQLDPAALRDRINAYFSMVMPIIRQHRGHIVDSVGDSIISVWVSTQNPQKACADACAAALQLHQQLNQTDINAHQLGQLPTRLGLHFGPVFIGQVGAGQHMEVRAVGDIVNTASRIQSANRYLDTKILLSDDIMQQLRQQQVQAPHTIAASSNINSTANEHATTHLLTLIRPLGLFQLSGKSNPMPLFQLPTPTLSEHAQLSFTQALQYFGGGQLEAAEQAFAQAVQHAPEDGVSRFYLGLCREMLHQLPPPARNGVALLPGK